MSVLYKYPLTSAQRYDIIRTEERAQARILLSLTFLEVIYELQRYHYWGRTRRYLFRV